MLVEYKLDIIIISSKTINYSCNEKNILFYQNNLFTGKTAVIIWYTSIEISIELKLGFRKA